MAQIKQLIIKIIKTKIQSSKQLPNKTQKKKGTITIKTALVTKKYTYKLQTLKQCI